MGTLEKKHCWRFRFWLIVLAGMAGNLVYTTSISAHFYIGPANDEFKLNRYDTVIVTRRITSVLTEFTSDKPRIERWKNPRIRLAQSNGIIELFPNIFKGLGFAPVKQKSENGNRGRTEIETNKKIGTTVKPSSRGSGKKPRLLYCVRLCDGYHWPIDEIALHKSTQTAKEFCTSSCSSPTKVYLSYGIGGSADDLIDVSGSRYSELKNSYRYRKEYIPSCRCRPDPWEAAELDRHMNYEKSERRNSTQPRKAGKPNSHNSHTTGKDINTGWNVEIRSSQQ